LEALVNLMWMVILLISVFVWGREYGIPPRAVITGFIPSGSFFMVGELGGALGFSRWGDMMALGVITMAFAPMIGPVIYKLRGGEFRRKS
jgi:hypothetical protein